MKGVVAESRKFRNDVFIDRGRLTDRNTAGEFNMLDNITFLFFKKKLRHGLL